MGDLIMALLIVQAAAEDGVLSAPGNRGTCLIPVSVTDSNGIPVTGLTVADFQVDAMVVGAFGANVVITRFEPVRLAGTYMLKVAPKPNNTWKAGTYIFAVAVTRGSDQGQAFCNPVLLD
jgi:hypothetical protein